MLLRLVLLLMHSVQVSFIPGSEKTSVLVGWQMVFEQQKWDKFMISFPSFGFIPGVFCTCELLSSQYALIDSEMRDSLLVDNPLCAVCCFSAAVFAVLLSLVAGSHSKIW